MEFNFITNPETGKNVSIFSAEGKKVLGNYVYANNQMKGGARTKKKKRSINKNCKKSVEKTPRNSKETMERCRRSKGRGNPKCEHGEKGQCKKTQSGGKRISKKRSAKKRSAKKRSAKKKSVKRSKKYSTYFS